MIGKKIGQVKIYGKWMLKGCNFRIMLRIEEDLKSEGKEEI